MSVQDVEYVKNLFKGSPVGAPLILLVINRQSPAGIKRHPKDMHFLSCHERLKAELRRTHVNFVYDFHQ